MKILLVILVLVCLGLQLSLWMGEGSHAQLARLEQEIQVQRMENDNLEQRNRILYAEVNELKTGMDAIEERARSELGMTKKDETFYLIVE
ncbi:MAG: septum formation initiator family protein [Pseudomonadales bacterium]|nr:septum formation initiator family protein [Pseudomonadales bacterium]